MSMGSRSRGYSAKCVAGRNRLNRIYLAIIVVKAIAILLLSLSHAGGFDCV